MIADSSTCWRIWRRTRTFAVRCQREHAESSIDGKGERSKGPTFALGYQGVCSRRHSEANPARDTVLDFVQAGSEATPKKGGVSMAHQRLGDFLRDDWAASMRPEAERRGWEFSSEWFPNEKDNTGYRASFRSVASDASADEESTGEIRSPSFRIVHILLHASHHSGAWAIPERHITWVERRIDWLKQHDGVNASYVVVLVDRKPESGYLLHPEDISRFRYPSKSLITIVDRCAAGFGYFRSAPECADLIECTERPLVVEAPGVAAERVSSGRPASPFCPAHHSLLIPREGRWICALCEKERDAAGTGR
jgi:hypothetical protein